MGTVSRFYMDPMTGIVPVAVQDAQKDAFNVCDSVCGGLRASLPCVCCKVSRGRSRGCMACRSPD